MDLKKAQIQRKNQCARAKRKVKSGQKMDALAETAFLVLNSQSMGHFKVLSEQLGIAGKLLFNQLLVRMVQDEAEVKEELKKCHYRTLQTVIKGYEAPTEHVLTESESSE